MGKRFSLIPVDALAFGAVDNENPLSYRNTTNTSMLFDIRVIDDEHMVVTPQREITHALANYLGGIVSNDRETLYWVNKTKPLP